MRALITNDDGVDSPGIHVLARAALAAGLDVTIAAPSWDSSGASASLTAVEHEGRVVVEPRTIEGVDGLESVTAFAIEAAPAFIARLGVDGGLGPAPDLVLSGINRGANTGQVVLHSGTVGAALTAGTHGVPAIAVSLASAAERALWAERTALHWSTAEEIAQRIIAWVVQAGSTPVLNVNVPDLPLDQVKGLRRATLATHGTVTATITEKGRGYVKVAFEQPGAATEPGTDAALLAAGYATYTPIRTVCEATLDPDPFDGLGDA